MPYSPAQAKAIFAKEIRKHGRKVGEKKAAEIVGKHKANKDEAKARMRPRNVPTPTNKTGGVEAPRARKKRA